MRSFLSATTSKISIAPSPLRSELSVVITAAVFLPSRKLLSVTRSAAFTSPSKLQSPNDTGSALPVKIYVFFPLLEITAN